MAGLIDPRTAFGQTVNKNSNKVSATTARKSYATPTTDYYTTQKGITNYSHGRNNNADTNTGGGSSGGSSGGSNTGTSAATSSYSQSLFDYFKEKNEKARQSSLDAILAKLKMGESQYNANIDNITDQYQALRNQSEVERYKSQRAIREALANRGQLDSGFGRQEQLELDTQYGNAINSLNTQETKAKNEVQNLIAQLRAEAELEKANIENQYNTAIENFKSQMGA